MSYDTRHGSPFDRGSADSYYGRPRSPHFFLQGTYMSDRIEAKDMSQGEIEAYHAGYDENEANGDKKDWN